MRYQRFCTDSCTFITWCVEVEQHATHKLFVTFLYFNFQKSFSIFCLEYFADNDEENGCMYIFTCFLINDRANIISSVKGTI